MGPFSQLGPSAAKAQNFGQRAVNGRVEDASSAAVSGATVFLRNTKTKSIRSYTSASDGRFRFVQVTMNDDYDLWAEKDGRKSPTRTVSSWDTRKEVEEVLKLK
jgi:hypothetical protein